MNIVLAQLNFRVGNIEYNLQKHIDAIVAARDQHKADLIIFPELSLTGYPPEDLLFRSDFLSMTYKALMKISEVSKNIYCLVGHPEQTKHGLHNACTMLHNGKILGTYAKQHLPNYGVFDEARYFKSADKTCVIDIKGTPVGLVICEDLWNPYSVRDAVTKGAKLILAPNASPFEMDKIEQRHTVIGKRAKENNVSIVYVNLVGGQDDLIYDGSSFIVDKNGSVSFQAEDCKETLIPINLDKLSATNISIPSKLERTYNALILSMRDYVQKNNFKSVCLGLSGGIDSALTLAIAVDALGNDAVTAVSMPSRYTSDMTTTDTKQIATNLKVKLETYSIEPSFTAFLETLKPAIAKTKPDVTEENIQARIRAIILMALSNKFGHLVLTTGNRSELAVGYCTLYGDMAGGFAVLKDVPKTLVYELANYRNQLSPIIPSNIIQRPPSAELAFNQTDQDTLPPYEILDQILELYLNRTMTREEIIAAGFAKNIVDKTIKLILHNEYKRKQGAIGPHLNHKSFIRDWRYPISNGWKG